MYAAMKGHKGCLRELLCAGADFKGKEKRPRGVRAYPRGGRRKRQVSNAHGRRNKVKHRRTLLGMYACTRTLARNARTHTHTHTQTHLYLSTTCLYGHTGAAIQTTDVARARVRSQTSLFDSTAENKSHCAIFVFVKARNSKI